MRPSPISLHHTSIPTSQPRTLPEHVHLTRHDPPLLNFPPTLPPQAGILKAGAVGIEASLKSKHALVLVMMGTAAAQIFTFLESLSKKRS